jgi:acetyltransferase-like isoleucine patch superfamily enzyme
MNNIPALVKRVKYSILKTVGVSAKHEDVRYQYNRISPNVSLGNAVLQGNCVIKERVFMSGNVTVGKYSTVGPECIFHGGNIQIGNYCQFGPRVAIYGLNHPMHRITTYVNKNLFEGRLAPDRFGKPVEIGHDVWIGYGAILLPGVKVGNGAIIGAGAVVSKDVGSYEVSVGNPAHSIKSRFDQELVDLLNRWQWWNLDPEELRQHESIFFEDIEVNPDVLRIYLKKVMAKK